MNRVASFIIAAWFAFLCMAGTACADALYLDPVGDVANPALADIVSIRAASDAGRVTFALTFANDIAIQTDLPQTDLRRLTTQIYIDTDQNRNTGSSSFASLGAPVDLGVDYVISTNCEACGAFGAFVQQRPDFSQILVLDAVRSTSRSISVTVPLAVLGNDDANLNFAVLVFGGVAVPTDRAPNGTTPFILEVPEPATYALLALGLLTLALLRRARNTQ